MALVPENKPYAHHKTHLHTMKVYKTRPVSLAIEVFPIKIVFFFPTIEAIPYSKGINAIKR